MIEKTINKKVRCAIGLPTNRLIRPKTAESLLKLVNHSKNIDIDILCSTRGFNTAENRNWISAQAVKLSCDYLFMVDDDMIYQPDTIDKLLECNKDIVGGIYKTKYEEQADVNEYFDKRPTELAECKALGGGLMLIKCDVFKLIPQPWYGYIWNDNGSVQKSNDWFFCDKAREFGIKIWCDPKVTAKHIGKFTY